jgi:hypothetical protein
VGPLLNQQALGVGGDGQIMAAQRGGGLADGVQNFFMMSEFAKRKTYARTEKGRSLFTSLKCDVRCSPDSVAKVENRTAPKISRKSIFSRLYRCKAS